MKVVSTLPSRFSRARLIRRVLLMEVKTEHRFAVGLDDHEYTVSLTRARIKGVSNDHCHSDARLAGCASPPS